MIILGLETSGGTASVAVCKRDGIIAQTGLLSNRTHSQIIMPMLKDVLRYAELSLEDIYGFAVSQGPGSYTGLRIGVSAIKAIGFSLSKQCAGISTLESLAFNMAGFIGYIRPVMAARGELVYTALFESDGDKIKRIEPDKIREISEVIQETKSLEGNVVINGDFCTHIKSAELFESPNIKQAPPHLRLQQASSLCFACFDKFDEHGDNAFIDLDHLNADYMEKTLAEKEIES